MAILNYKYFDTNPAVHVEEEAIEIEPKVFDSSISVMEATFQAVIENEMNWNSVEKAIAVSELAYFVEEGQEEDYKGPGKLEKVKNTVSNFLKQIIAKLMGLWVKVLEKLDIMLNKLLSKFSIEKDKELIELGIKNVKNEILEGYDISDISTTQLFNSLNVIISGYSGKSAETIATMGNSRMKDVVKTITGSDDLSAEGIKNAIYGKKINLLKSKYANFNYMNAKIKGLSNTINELKAAKKDASKILKSAIKVCESASKSSNNDDVAKYYTEVGRCIGADLNTFTMVNGVILNAVIDSFRQVMQIEFKLKAIGAAVKAGEKADNTENKAKPTSKPMIEGVQFV